MKKPVVIILIVIFIGSLLLVRNLDRNLAKQPHPNAPASDGGTFLLSNSPSQSNPLNPDHKIVLPLRFPIKGLNREIIPKIPDSRIPGAPRTYRGSNSRHEGLDIYAGECKLPVLAVADGWIIDISSTENFPSAEVRDSILQIAAKTGFTPDPILENLHGRSLVIFHGWADTACCYARYSHFENLAENWKIGDFVKSGQIIGYIGASGTSAQFKPPDEKQQGCHLHFEWHEIKNGEDFSLGFNERDNDLKRKLYYDLFSSDDG
ncbi:M23 family metallopeptidase [bacterium]|nr:M23 family metallopeptidase [bacterium]MBU1025836.1 M23 family metallopeptidase [bacterium]